MLQGETTERGTAVIADPVLARKVARLEPLICVMG
jgi:hypothetical protein